MRLLLAVLTVLVFSTVGLQASEAKDRFVGTWTLEVVEALDDAGQWAPRNGRFGGNPVGSLIYDSAGNMAVQIMRSDRLLFAAEDFEGATPDEAKGAFVGYTAYFGAYDVDEEEGSVTHHRTGHLMPNRVGVDAKRFYRFHGERLTLTLPSREVRLSWVRSR